MYFKEEYKQCRNAALLILKSLYIIPCSKASQSPAFSTTCSTVKLQELISKWLKISEVQTIKVSCRFFNTSNGIVAICWSKSARVTYTTNQLINKPKHIQKSDKTQNTLESLQSPWSTVGLASWADFEQASQSICVSSKGVTWPNCVIFWAGIQVLLVLLLASEHHLL